MGMFDEIRIEQILPGNTKITDKWFQTKSFDNHMVRYVINANGELYKEHWDYEWVSDEGYIFFKGYLQKVKGSYRREYLTDFHGDVIFYAGWPDASVNEDRVWRDYTARFTEGKLTKVWYTDSKY